MRDRKIARIVAIMMVTGAAIIRAETTRQAMASDDGGPPIGACGMAAPAFVLLVLAGVLWSRTNEPPIR